MEAANTPGKIGAATATRHAGYVSDVDYFLTLLAERNTRFDSEIRAVNAALNTLRDSLVTEIDSIAASTDHRLAETDLRYQQRFELEKAAREASAVAADRAVVAALEAADKAVAKAELASEKRFDSVNEFRAQLRDQAATFIPRIEAEHRLSQLGARLDGLRTSDDQRTGRSAGSAALYGWLVGGIGALAAVVVIAGALFR